MDRRIWEYEIGLNGETTLEIPSAATLVMVDTNHPTGSVINLWFEVLVVHGKEKRTFTVYGTGHPIDEGCDHVGSVLTNSGLVWHVYELWR